MAFRHACLIPGCKRHTNRHPDANEWICGPHWRGVPLRWRRLNGRLNRLANSDPARLGRLAVMHTRVWERCKLEAIKAAAGI